MGYVLKYFNFSSNLGQKFNCPEPNGTFEDFKWLDYYTFERIEEYIYRTLYSFIIYNVVKR